MSLDSWQQVTLALQLLAGDARLGGLVLRARSGPVRDVVLMAVQGLPSPVHRLHPGVSDEALFGGVDLAGTLAVGEIVRRAGLLDAPATLVLTMAERCTPHLAARLATALDRGIGHRLIVLDEGANEDEVAPPALLDRCAFYVDLTDVGLHDLHPLWLPQARANAAPGETTLDDVVHIAAGLGVDSMRAPMFAARAAVGLAALAGRAAPDLTDLETAAMLTLAHRATQFPDDPSDPPSPPETTDQSTEPEQGLQLPDEIVLEAIRAMLPDDLLARVAARKVRLAKGQGQGALRKGNRRGRPLPSRPGRLADGHRIDLVGTLRAAAPWQMMRRQATGRDGLHIRGADIHIKRFTVRSDRLLIFAVDASGSSALARLAEAKGAIELLLAQAYSSRDHVSLIAFRGDGAEVLLAPTRSLVQTKRRLAALPGGGGTPLAAGLKESLAQAHLARRKGLTPTLVLLTDGRANIALSGDANRAQAAADASQMARLLAAGGIAGLVIDTGQRPDRSLQGLAATMDAPYLPLPRVDAQRLSAAVTTALDG